MKHKHYCVGKCGAYVLCDYAVIRDDCGAHCEQEESPGFEEYECQVCFDERMGEEDYADAVAEDSSHVE